MAHPPDDQSAPDPGEPDVGDSIYPELAPPSKPAGSPSGSTAGGSIRPLKPAVPPPPTPAPGGDAAESIYPALAPNPPANEDGDEPQGSIYPALAPHTQPGAVDKTTGGDSIIPLPPKRPAPGTIPPPRPVPTQGAGDSAPPPQTMDRRRVRRTQPESVSAMPVVSLEHQSALEGSQDARAKYDIVKELGRGGMGAVFAVTDRALGRTVAMKVTHNADGEARARFIREARITGQLEHPNIVPVHELANDGRQDFFTMKMVRGRALSDAIRELRDRIVRGASDASFPLAERLDVFRKVCDALAYAHSCGVLHRDLKPDNIMVGEFGEVQVMDWGLARLLDEPDTDAPPPARGAQPARSATKRGTQLKIGDDGDSGRTMDGSIMGTPQYMPPEQAEGRVSELDERADVYSLGAILHELLALAPAFRPEAVMMILARVTDGDFVPAHEQAAKDKELKGRLNVPPELGAIATRAMAMRPRDRYPSARDLRHDIDRYLDGRLVGAAQYSLLGRFSKFAARNRAGVIAAIIIVVLGIAGALGAASWAEQARQAELDRVLGAPRTTLRAARAAADEISASRSENDYEAAVSAAMAFLTEHGTALADLQRLEPVRTHHPEWITEAQGLIDSVTTARDATIREWAAATLQRLPSVRDPRAASMRDDAKQAFGSFRRLVEQTGATDVPFAAFTGWLAGVADAERAQLENQLLLMTEADDEWTSLTQRVRDAERRTTEWVVAGLLAQPESPAVAESLTLLAERALQAQFGPSVPEPLVLRFHQVLSLPHTSDAVRARAWIGMAEALLRIHPDDPSPVGESVPSNIMALRCLLQILQPDGSPRAEFADHMHEVQLRHAQHLLMVARRTAAYRAMPEVKPRTLLGAPRGHDDEVWWPDPDTNQIRRVRIVDPPAPSSAPPTLQPLPSISLDWMQPEQDKPLRGIEFPTCDLPGTPHVLIAYEGDVVFLGDFDANGRARVLHGPQSGHLNHACVDFADFDGDGDADVIYAYGNAAWARLGNGDGTFGPEQFVNPESMRTGTRAAMGGVAAGDLDGDGRAELIVSRSVWNHFTVEVWKMDGGAPRFVCDHVIGDSRVRYLPLPPGSSVPGLIGASPEVVGSIAAKWKSLGRPITPGMRLVRMRGNQLEDLPVPPLARQERNVRKDWSGLTRRTPLDGDAAMVLDRAWVQQYGRALIWHGRMDDLTHADVFFTGAGFDRLGSHYRHMIGQPLDRIGVSRRLRDDDLALIARDPVPLEADVDQRGEPAVRFARLMMGLREFNGVIQVVAESLPTDDPALRAELTSIGLHAMLEAGRYGDLLTFAERIPHDPGLAPQLLWAVDRHIRYTGGHLPRIEALLDAWSGDHRMPPEQLGEIGDRLTRVRAARAMIATDGVGYAGTQLIGGEPGATLAQHWVGDTGFYVPDGSGRASDSLYMISDGSAFLPPLAQDSAMPAIVRAVDGSDQLASDFAVCGVPVRLGMGDLSVTAEFDMPGMLFAHMVRLGVHRLSPPGTRQEFVGINFSCGGQASVFNAGWAGAQLTNLIGHRLRLCYERLPSLGVTRMRVVDVTDGNRLITAACDRTDVATPTGATFIVGLRGHSGGYYGRTWGQLRLHRLVVRGDVTLLSRESPDVQAILAATPSLAEMTRAVAAGMVGDRETAMTTLLRLADRFDAISGQVPEHRERVVRHARRLRLQAARIASGGDPAAFATALAGRADLDDIDISSWLTRQPVSREVWAAAGQLWMNRLFPGQSPRAVLMSNALSADMGVPSCQAVAVAALARTLEPAAPDLINFERQAASLAVLNSGNTLWHPALQEYLLMLPYGPQPPVNQLGQSVEYVARAVAINARAQRSELVEHFPVAGDALIGRAFGDPGLLGLHRDLHANGVRGNAAALRRLDQWGLSGLPVPR